MRFRYRNQSASVLTLRKEGNVRYESEPTLTGLPGTRRDEFGNLLLKRGDDMRRRWVHLLRVKSTAFARPNLAELLNWFRWGSQDGVMWECTAAELFRIIDRWEAANPDAPMARYGIREEMPPSEIGAFWSDYARMLQIVIRYRCVQCKILFPPDRVHCSKCDSPQWDSTTTKEAWGPRGKGSYNLALEGADGYAVAAYAWATRGRTRTIPAVAMPM